MTREELDKTLQLHQKWLNSDPEGVRADMRMANMRDANMSGANIDYLTITLWCGTLRIRIDNRITSQLLYHVLSCVEVSPDVSDDVKKVLLSPEVVAIANRFHRCTSGEVPAIGEYRDDAP